MRLESSGLPEMGDSLRGQFLIASKPLRDPNFYKTVVLIVEHGSGGAMGLVVNRPSSVTVAHALSNHFNLPETDDVVYVGGPVEPAALFITHTDAEMEVDESPIVPGLFVGSSPDVFEAVVRRAANGAEGCRYRIFSGCAGWGPEQLESEISRGDWWQYPADLKHIFEEDPYELWDCMAEKVRVRNQIISDRGHRPEFN